MIDGTGIEGPAIMNLEPKRVDVAWEHLPKDDFPPHYTLNNPIT